VDDTDLRVKLNRQDVVVGGRAPGLDVVITMGALRQSVGPPRVMREQLAPPRGRGRDRVSAN
jgi:Domain of unknown function (DUF5753)